MAQHASVDIIDAVTDTSSGEGDPNIFRQLMDGGQENAKSAVMINPQIADSLGDVGARNLDALGANAATGKTQIGPDGDVEVAKDDRGRLFTLVSTDPDAAKDLNTQVGVYQADQLRDAIKTGDDDALSAAAERNGNLDGYMNAGRVNANLIGDRLGHEVDLSEYEDARKAAGLAKGFALSALSTHPAGALASPVANEVGNMLINDLIPESEDQDSYYVAESGDADALATRAAYDYLQAKQEISGDPLDDIPSVTDENGDLKPWDQLSDDARSRVRTADGVDIYTDVNFYNPAGRFDQAALDDKGTNFEQRVDDYLNGTQ